MEVEPYLYFVQDLLGHLEEVEHHNNLDTKVEEDMQDLLGHFEEVEHHNNLDTEVEEDMQEVQPMIWPSLYF